MIRRTSETTSEEKGGERLKDTLDAAIPATTGYHSLPVVNCPINKCDGYLINEVSSYDSRSGLEILICSKCGHRGFRSQQGIILLFRGGYEFKLSYGPSLETLTILLSSAAVNLWSTHDVNETQLAKLAAEWALLCGHRGNQVHLGLLAEEFADFYLYFSKALTTTDNPTSRPLCRNPKASMQVGKGKPC